MIEQEDRQVDMLDRERAKLREVVTTQHVDTLGFGGEVPGDSEPGRPPFNVRALMLFLQRRWRIIFATTVACILLGIVYYNLAPTIFIGRATLLLESRTPRSVQDPAAALAQASNENGRIETELQVLQSNEVLEPVVDQLSLLDDPEFNPKPGILSWVVGAVGPLIEVQRPKPSGGDVRQAVVERLREGMMVRRFPRASIIEVTFTGRERKRVAQIVSAVVDSYLGRQRQSDARLLQETLQWNEKRKAQLLIAASQAAQKVQDYRSAHSAIEQEMTEEGRRAQIDFQMLTDAANTARNNYLGFLQRLADNAFDIPVRSIDVQTITQATPPLYKTAPKASIVFIGAVLGGCLLGLAAAFFAENWRSGRLGAPQLEEFTRLDCIGVMPALPRRKTRFFKTRRIYFSRPAKQKRVLSRDIGHRRGMIGNPSSAFVRALSSLIDWINDAELSCPGRVIGLTSALPGAGCSTLSINMAGIAAALGDKVLLIDCQFRNPTLSRVLTPNSKAGVEQVARGLCSLGEAVWNDPRTGLDVLPASGSALVQQGLPLPPDMISCVLQEARSQYNTIVLDLSFPETAREARAFSSVTDYTYLVIEQSLASLDELRQRLQICSRGGMRLSGFILNKATF
jgi:uncharacterized protein involved in exopolysaccharide biosynthesis/Mrp family chromosome partitioning ATPase